MQKKRISMTISPEILKSLDSIVDGVKIRSRSEAIEAILSKHLASAKTAVFLGGGSPDKLRLGGRLKPLLEIGGKPLIVHNTERLRKAGFTNIFFIGSSEVIGECFKAIGNGSRYGINISYIEEQRALGNAKTLQLAEGRLKSSFLVLPVDNFFDFDLNYLSKIHKTTGAVATLAVQAGRSATELGMVDMLGNRIIKYEEVPKKPKTSLTATFIGMYDPVIFQHIPKGDVRCTLQTDVFPKLMEEEGLYGSIVPGFYINIRKESDVREARSFVRNK